MSGLLLESSRSFAFPAKAGTTALASPTPAVLLRLIARNRVSDREEWIPAFAGKAVIVPNKFYF
jgi:hypothetical protein